MVIGKKVEKSGSCRISLQALWLPKWQQMICENPSPKTKPNTCKLLIKRYPWGAFSHLIRGEVSSQKGWKSRWLRLLEVSDGYYLTKAVQGTHRTCKPRCLSEWKIFLTNLKKTGYIYHFYWKDNCLNMTCILIGASKMSAMAFVIGTIANGKLYLDTFQHNLGVLC